MRRGAFGTGSGRFFGIEKFPDDGPGAIPPQPVYCTAPGKCLETPCSAEKHNCGWRVPDERVGAARERGDTPYCSERCVAAAAKAADRGPLFEASR